MGNGLFIPSLLISEIYHPYCLEKGFTARLLDRVASEGFYRAVEIGYGFDQEERKQIRDMAEQQDLTVTQWLTSLINEKNLDVSAIDPTNRLASVRQLKDSMYLAAECGAANIAFISGPDPGADLRKAAMESFYLSLCEICEEAAQYNMKVLVEPLDRDAHKKRFLGPTNEAVALFTRVRESYSNIGLGFDTAHAALNGEDITQALHLAREFIGQIHFSNAVLDPTDTLYGDHHIPIGKPGFLDVSGIRSLLQKAEELGLTADSLRIAVEVRGTEQQSVHENERVARTVLESALAGARV
ncbi:sugar phosphate isomerase/epimerase [Neobacillus niacini]|uniref:sugar phosphate isomerase/epimerase family protein n=1 Tax=Neobacillus niacini TaxID=86668 RepID=UPI0021CB8EA1|nr:sugar phosphate isomerase/epimerase family protein [Neobacillus niacini]MCM3763863.1 sugar phosphate isomerase/epimerase [Neobacillus niacini]